MKKYIKISLAIVVLISCVIGAYWMATISSDNKIDKTEYNALYRAAVEIEIGIILGVNYSEFHQLLKNLLTEIYVVSLGNKEKLSKREAKFIYILLASLEEYKQSLELWKLNIKESSDNQGMNAIRENNIQTFWKNGRDKFAEAQKIWVQ
jgi:hypothetical protein